MLRKAGLLLFIILTSCITALADGNKVETIGAYTDQTASESVRKSLDARGYRVTLSDGGAHCEIWLRAGLPAGKTDTPGAVYNNLGESTLVGVITFLKQASDFRGQTIKPGSYTLRYALHPTDGNHMGISPVRDFLVLIPVAIDQNVDGQYKFEELMKMSTKASGTNHPLVLSLVAPEGKPAPAAVKDNDHGHVVFSASLKTASGTEVPLSFVVKGIAEQ
jgi:hypothetical protein